MRRAQRAMASATPQPAAASAGATPAAATDGKPDSAFDDLLWDLDITTERPVPAPIAPVHPQHPPAAAAAPPRSPAQSAPKKPASDPSTPRAVHRRGAHYRPELQTPWERVAGNRFAQIGGAVVLLSGTAALVVVAVSR